MGRIEKFAKVLILAITLILMAQSSRAGELPPSEIITCNGCNLLRESADKFSTAVQQDSTITLVGPAGYQSYIWTRDDGQTISGQTITAKILKGTVYKLTLNGNRVKTVQINLVSNGNTCLPDLSEIEIDNTYISVGDRINVKISWSNDNNCANINFYWEIESGSGLAIENKNSKETWIKVLAKPSAGKNPVIKAIITNGKFWSEKTVTVVIVDNTAPMVKGRYSYTTPLSHTEFQVSCSECWTGTGYNENSDSIAEFTALLRNAAGQVISSGTVTAKRGENLRTVALKPGDEGDYTIEVIAKDSHGLSSSVVESLPVGFGNTEDDIPFIVVNETIFCGSGKPCPIDASKTYTHDLGVSVRFYDITRERPESLYGVNGALCTTFNCTALFHYPYAYKVLITMAYIRNGEVADKPSQKIITVIVSETGTQAPLQTPQAIKPVSVPAKTLATAKPVLTPQPPPEVPAKPSPGLNPTAIFVVLIAAGRILGRKNKH